MGENGGRGTFDQSSYLPTKDQQTAYGRAINGFIERAATSALAMLILPTASLLAIVLTILAFGLFVYALKNLGSEASAAQSIVTSPERRVGRLELRRTSLQG